MTSLGHQELLKNGEIWFVGKDVATILGYTNPRKAITDHVKDTHKNTVTIRDGIGNPNKTIIDEDKMITKGGDLPLLKVPNRGLTIINESVLYSLIFSSKLPRVRRKGI